MAVEIQNVNPTILSFAQLPSRRQQKRGSLKDRPEYVYDGILSMRHSGAPWGRNSYDEAPDDSPWPSEEDGDDSSLTEEPIDEQEIYDLISGISDPEHPHTLGQLSVVNLPDIHLAPLSPQTAGPHDLMRVVVDVTPTINHCSLATVIGLAVRVRLERTLPPNYRVDVRIKEGSHADDSRVSKQLADKERVAAALENETLRNMVDSMLKAPHGD